MAYQKEVLGVRFEATDAIATSALMEWKMKLDEGIPVTRSYAGFDLSDTHRGDFLLKFGSTEEREAYISKMESLRGGRTPEYQFPTDRMVKFEYKGKAYLVIEALYELTDVTDDCLYRGVVVDPFKYGGTQTENASETVQGAREALDGALFKRAG